MFVRFPFAFSEQMVLHDVRGYARGCFQNNGFLKRCELSENNGFVKRCGLSKNVFETKCSRVFAGIAAEIFQKVVPR